MLQPHLQGLSDQSVLALMDSSTSYNFVSKGFAAHLGWKPRNTSTMKVCLANGKKMQSSGTVIDLIQCGLWQVHVCFVILDLILDMVLGMLWLTAVNPWLDWARCTLAVQMKG